MHTDSLKEEVKAFFDEFAEVFPTFDGERIARRYLAPYLSIPASGSSQLFSSAESIAQYFQGIVSRYREQGCVACRYSDLEAMEMGRNAAVATVTWELLRTGGSVLSAWKESYNLVRTESGLKACVSVDHAQ